MTTSRDFHHTPSGIAKFSDACGEQLYWLALTQIMNFKNIAIIQ